MYESQIYMLCDLEWKILKQFKKKTHSLKSIQALFPDEPEEKIEDIIDAFQDMELIDENSMEELGIDAPGNSGMLSGFYMITNIGTYHLELHHRRSMETLRTVLLSLGSGLFGSAITLIAQKLLQ